jgi:solute carrier family 25 folate transporter 32
MPPKHDESSPCSSQNTENGLLSVRQHELCPHESSSCLSHLERLTARFSDPSIRSLAGATSGVASSVVICPLDVMKTKLQGRGGLQLWTLDPVSKRRSFQDRGLIGTGRAIWHEGGLVGMYQGLGPTMLASLPRGAIYFTLYHKVNDSLKERFSKPPRSALCPNSHGVVLPSAKRPRTDVGILQCVRCCWRYLFYIIHESLVGYQD